VALDRDRDGNVLYLGMGLHISLHGSLRILELDEKAPSVATESSVEGLFSFPRREAVPTQKLLSGHYRDHAPRSVVRLATLRTGDLILYPT
jgi:hypothetical protein